MQLIGIWCSISSCQSPQQSVHETFSPARAVCLGKKTILSGTDIGIKFNLQSNYLFSKITLFQKH